jgi:hypothetical protein
MYFFIFLIMAFWILLAQLARIMFTSQRSKDLTRQSSTKIQRYFHKIFGQKLMNYNVRTTHRHTDTQTHTHTHTETHTHSRVHTHTHSHTHTYANTHTRTHCHTHTHAHTHTFTHIKHIYIKEIVKT